MLISKKILSPLNLQQLNYKKGHFQGHDQTKMKVWFGCKVCSNTFPNLDSFIKHKIQNHLGRFDKIRSIVFEEKTVYFDDDDDDQDIFIAPTDTEVSVSNINTNIPVSELKGDTNENSLNHQDNTETPLLEEDLQLHSSTSNYAELETNGIKCSECDTNSYSENGLISTSPTFSHESSTEPDVAIKNMQTDIIVTNQFDKTHKGISGIPENNVCDLPIRYNPFVLINRLTPAEIQGANSFYINCAANNFMQSNAIDSDHIQEIPNKKTQTNIETHENCGSGDSGFALEDNSPSSFADSLSESEFYENLDASDTFIEPEIEITVLDDDIDVDLNVNGAAWGESGASTSATQTGQGSDAAYEEFLLRYSPFVPLKRLTPHEVEDAAAGKLNFLNNYVPAFGRQLLLAVRNQDDEDDEMEFNGEADASLLNSDGTGSRFLDDCYEVNLTVEGHIVFKPKTTDHHNVDPPLDDTSIVCTVCKFVTDSKVSLKNHMKIHSNALMCSHVDCFASFDFRPSLQRHYDVYHSPLKPFRCPHDGCYQAYEAHHNLKLHSMDHSGERPFPCTHENCTKEYKCKPRLDRHTSTAHSNDRPFKCPRNGCSKEFGYSSILNRHLRKHTAGRRCPNRRCRKLCSTSYNLSVHFKVCNNTRLGNTSATSKRLPCPHDGCHKACYDPWSLKLHLMDHSGERPFPCTRENCTKAFKTKQELASHTSYKHSDELPVKCPRKGCSKGFHSTGLDYVSHISKCQKTLDHKKCVAGDRVPPRASSGS